MASILATSVIDMAGSAAAEIIESQAKRAVNATINAVAKFVRKPGRVIKAVTRPLKLIKRLKLRCNSKFDSPSESTLTDVRTAEKYLAKVNFALGRRQRPRKYAGRNMDVVNIVTQAENDLSQSSSQIASLAFDASRLRTLCSRMNIPVETALNKAALNLVPHAFAGEAEFLRNRLMTAVRSGGLDDLIEVTGSSNDTSKDLLSATPTSTSTALPPVPRYSSTQIAQLQNMGRQLRKCVAALVAKPDLTAMNDTTMALNSFAFVMNVFSLGRAAGIAGVVDSTTNTLNMAADPFHIRAKQGILWYARYRTSVLTAGVWVPTTDLDLRGNGSDSPIAVVPWGGSSAAEFYVGDPSVNGTFSQSYGWMAPIPSKAYVLSKLPSLRIEDTSMAGDWAGGWSPGTAAVAGDMINEGFTAVFIAQEPVNRGSSPIASMNLDATRNMYQRREVTTVSTQVTVDLELEFDYAGRTNGGTDRVCAVVSVLSGYYVGTEAFFPPQTPSTFYLVTRNYLDNESLVTANGSYVQSILHPAYAVPCVMIRINHVNTYQAVTFSQYRLTPHVNIVSSLFLDPPMGGSNLVSYYDKAMYKWTTADPQDTVYSLVSKSSAGAAGAYPYGTLWSFLQVLVRDNASGFYALAHLLHEKFAPLSPSYASHFAADKSLTPAGLQWRGAINKANASKYVWDLISPKGVVASAVSVEDINDLLSDVEMPQFNDLYLGDLLSRLKSQGVETYPLAGQVTSANDMTYITE